MWRGDHIQKIGSIFCRDVLKPAEVSPSVVPTRRYKRSVGSFNLGTTTVVLNLRRGQVVSESPPVRR